jgi:hypothetical protein
MKIRIRGNSIRYRLDKKDIQLLQEEQRVEENTTIGFHILRFSIISGGDIPSIQLETSQVQLSLPARQVNEWISTEQVGFSHELANPDGSVLQLLIEKDFKCLTERAEDDSMAFDNPANSC